MFRFLKASFFVLLFVAGSLIANQNNTNIVKCSPQLREAVSRIQQLPEGQKLIEKVQEEGAISVMVNGTNVLNKFGAFWDPDDRVIVVNMSNKNSLGEVIGSIMFELHNALINKKLNHLDQLAMQRKIKREEYVRAVELLEFHNSKNASYLTEKGIKLGIFPSSAYLPTYNTFNEHYQVQIEAGHSAWIARTYDQLSQGRAG